MILKEENFEEIINSYTEVDWKPLLKLIPEIENSSDFGAMLGGDSDKNDIITIPHSVHSEIVVKFLNVVYSIPIIIDFDWVTWDEGRNIAANESFSFNTIDIPTKCKLISAFVRNDRFCDGVLLSYFESGTILRILKSIQHQLSL